MRAHTGHGRPGQGCGCRRPNRRCGEPGRRIAGAAVDRDLAED
uniref:Uncharacterized protein n=1 Tax=Arundo donax TaxID=35708 RepID=A0A0A9HE92_ARUDO